MLIARDVDTRLRSERAVGGEPRDDRQVVPPPVDDRDGDLRARDEHRVHGGVSAGRRAGAVVRVANRVGRDWLAVWSFAWRRLRGCSIGRRPIDRRGRGRRWRGPARHADRGVQATLGEALRSPAFWVFALASSVYGLVASGIGLLNESILVERGFTPDIYYQALAVTAITGLLGNFAAGALAGRTSLRSILVPRCRARCRAHGARARVHRAQVMAQRSRWASPAASSWSFSSLLGSGVRRAHLGRIQGAAQALTVVASAVGPLFLAMWSDAVPTRSPSTCSRSWCWCSRLPPRW